MVGVGGWYPQLHGGIGLWGGGGDCGWSWLHGGGGGGGGGVTGLHGGGDGGGVGGGGGGGGEE